MLELSDLFIKKCYFPVLRLHHLQKSEIIVRRLLTNISREGPFTQPCGRPTKSALTEVKEEEHSNSNSECGLAENMQAK